MTRIIITTLTVASLVLLGGPTACDKSQGAGGPSSGAEPAGSAQKGGDKATSSEAAPRKARTSKAAGAGLGDANLKNKLQQWFTGADRPFKAVDIEVPVEKLDDTGALSVHVYESPKPAVRFFVFEFADAQLAARGVTSIVGWINRSGLVYQGEATVNKQLVIVVGVPEAGDLDEETKTAVNDFMDAFMLGR